MMRNPLPFSSFALNTTLLVILASWHTTLLAENSWPQWRGADQNGVAVGDDFPISWSEEEGVAWKSELPGLGGSTPVVHGNRAFMTAGIDGKNHLLAFELSNGKLEWKTELGEDRGNKHAKGSGSNPSAVVDGNSVFAYFRSGDLACVDFDGNVRWQTNIQEEFGEDSLWWDLGSSPMLTDDAIVVVVMQTGPSYLVAYDRQTGKKLWKSDRTVDAPKDAAQSYTTPIAVKVKGKDAIAIMGADYLTLHSADDGSELGRLGGFNPTNHEFFRSISSPVAEGSIVVCPYARGDSLTAVDMDQLADGKGKDAIVWFRDDLGSDVPTPIAHNGKVYVVSDGKRLRGTISGLDLQTGKTLWSLKLPKTRKSFSSSPLLAGGHLYVTREDSVTHVIGPLDAEEPAVVSANAIGDDELTVASPVPLDGALLLRSRGSLYRIAGK